jgi:hypothetical protein
MFSSASGRLFAPRNGWRRRLTLAVMLVCGVGPLTSFANQAAFEGLLISKATKSLAPQLPDTRASK